MRTVQLETTLEIKNTIKKLKGKNSGKVKEITTEI